MYLDIAERVAKESHANRLKVGSVFVSEDGVMSIGINGLPENGSNECEDENGKTRLEVSHAEENLLTKLLKQGVSTKNGIIFLTHSPCINCIKLLANSGIKEVYYLHNHNEIDKSIEYAKSFDIKLIRFIK